ncbi:hypothetical protein [Botryobacter ruber]|uniref:hypothetical protein n=1 Tax=Botryobacter ruber TaxID=2171629 RepID=UPI000E0B069D|nr:hypothetical protein [Botryobacter ruber]
MTPLAADQQNSEFFRSFFTETLYLLPDEEAFAVAQPATERTVPAPTAPPTAQEQPAPASPPATKASAAPFDIIGSNGKGVVVLVTLPDAAFRALPQQEFLRKILQAIGLSPADVAFVNNVSGQVAQFEALEAALEVSYIISFASRIDTQHPHEKFMLYKPVVVDQVPIVFSQSLAVLDTDQEQKKLLWNALRQVFL